MLILHCVFSFRAQVKTPVKRKPPSDGGSVVPPEATRKAVKKAGPGGTSQVLSGPAASARRAPPSAQPTVKKQKGAGQWAVEHAALCLLCCSHSLTF